MSFQLLAFATSFSFQLKASLMAPITTDNNASSVPLADYFFIAGIESSQVFDERTAQPTTLSPPVETTIEEDKALETEADSVTSPRPSTPSSPNPDAPKRRSRYSFEARKSIGSMIAPLDGPTTGSNRSSTTIKAIQVGGSGLNDEDFEQALRNFANERDSFLEDIHISAGTVLPQSKPTKPRPKTVRISANPEETGAQQGGLRNGVGSLRRKLSTMNSMRRPPSTSRQCMSSYIH